MYLGKQGVHGKISQGYLIFATLPNSIAKKRVIGEDYEIAARREAKITKMARGTSNLEDKHFLTFLYSSILSTFHPRHFFPPESPSSLIYAASLLFFVSSTSFQRSGPRIFLNSCIFFLRIFQPTFFWDFHWLGHTQNTSGTMGRSWAKRDREKYRKTHFGGRTGEHIAHIFL